jgi:mRNA turnover protein 4
MRSNKFKAVRVEFRDSKLFLGKNKLLQIALGRNEEEEYQENLKLVSKQIAGGSVGLLLTSRTKDDVVQYFKNLEEPDYARAGSVSPETVIISLEQLSQFPVSMMEQFRKLGMPVDIINGKVVLTGKAQEYRLCKEGEILSAEKCKLLCHFEKKLAKFRVQLMAHWCGGEFEPLA